MKKVILLLSVFLAAASADAQSVRRFSFATDFGTGIALSEPASTPFLWRVTASCNIGRRFSAGAGTGLSFYEKTLIPVFADMRFLVARPRRFTPFLQCAAGYAFAPDRDANGGLLFTPALGVQVGLPKGLCVVLSLGYEQQKFTRAKRSANDFFSAAFEERLNHRTITLRAGLLF